MDKKLLQYVQSDGKGGYKYLGKNTTEKPIRGPIQDEFKKLNEIVARKLRGENVINKDIKIGPNKKSKADAKVIETFFTF